MRSERGLLHGLQFTSAKFCVLQILGLWDPWGYEVPVHISVKSRRLQMRSPALNPVLKFPSLHSPLQVVAPSNLPPERFSAPCRVRRLTKSAIIHRYWQNIYPRQDVVRYDHFKRDCIEEIWEYSSEFLRGCTVPYFVGVNCGRRGTCACLRLRDQLHMSTDRLHTYINTYI